MWKRVKSCIDICNPFTISTLINDIKNDTNKIISKIDSESDVIEKLENEIDGLRMVKNRYKNMVVAIGNTIPDMMWFKSVDGKYEYVNDAIRNGLFYGMARENILGRDDLEIAADCRKIAGKGNHTFGVICGNSDKEVLTHLVKERFLEWGLVGGKDMYLEVYKAPIYNKEGILIGTVGTGRDVTDYYLGLKDTMVESKDLLQVVSDCPTDNGCHDRLDMLINQFGKQLDKYKFEEE